MKCIKLCLFLTFLLCKMIPLHGCPTCIGHIEKNSPPFFSDEQYQPGEWALDDDNDFQTEDDLRGEDYE